MIALAARRRWTPSPPSPPLRPPRWCVPRSATTTMLAVDGRRSRRRWRQLQVPPSLDARRLAAGRNLQPGRTRTRRTPYHLRRQMTHGGHTTCSSVRGSAVGSRVCRSAAPGAEQRCSLLPAAARDAGRPRGPRIGGLAEASSCVCCVTCACVCQRWWCDSTLLVVYFRSQREAALSQLRQQDLCSIARVDLHLLGAGSAASGRSLEHSAALSVGRS